MGTTQIKLLVASLALVTGIALLAFDGSRAATVYYQTIPEFRSSPPSGTRPVRLTGYVVEGTIKQAPGQPLRFVMQDKERTTVLEVAYDDIVPDTFKDHAEVVVEGTMGAGGVFEASTLLAKCPSKYESGQEQTASAAVRS